MASRQIRPIRVEGNIAYVPLTRGYEAIIDAADVPLVAEHSWFSVVQDHAVYAVRRVPGVTGRGSKVSMHRQIMMPGQTQQVDHINLNGLDNRRANMRLCSAAENARNRRKSAANTSGLKGVCWNKASKKWQAGIRCDGKTFHLGLYDTPDDAHAAYAKASAARHGDFGRVA
jgi:hypothetical protein